ncbi:MAG: UDP-N-acetylglucosamine 1-carboxyvinyltransferase [Clostridia bacterium]|nr:UDP-N-acetylglucosamine 1-carboxyvinyltransferase [Clostridia bacterium]
MSGFFEITGGRSLKGAIKIQGAKNSALPILAATVLVDGEAELRNCPRLSDVDATVNILKHFGCRVSRQGHTLRVDSRGINDTPIPDRLMHEMRSSIIFLGAVLGRFGQAVLSAPGGCDIGLRPIDLHLDAMRAFGAQITESHGRICCTCAQGLRGTDITLAFPSVGATENIMLAAVTAAGKTTVCNAAREPEITDLADFLNTCGARITGAGSGEMVIEGVPALHGGQHAVIPDRIVAGSYLAAAAATGGEITVQNVNPSHLSTVLPVFRDAGCKIDVQAADISLRAPMRPRAVKYIRTMPYPGFPTDLQAPVSAFLCVAEGTSVISETIFENRYKHAAGLNRLGADIRVDGRTAIIEGVPRLTGAAVESPDLRGGFALVLAGLAAEGVTRVGGIRHVERGYEDICGALTSLGAAIVKIDGT